MNATPATPVHKATPGPILVLAGPGTGKTHSMALRVKWLVQELGVKPDTITVITFTAEAALNMRHRLSDEEKQDVFLPRDLQPVQISTMHSLGQQIISTDLQLVNLDEKFKILDSDPLRKLLFGDSAQASGLSCNHGTYALLLKASGTRIAKEHELWPTTKHYNSILRTCNFIDFDDQILLATDLLISSPTLLSEYQARATHLLVDEYQDINKSQFELVKLLAGNDARGLFAVGDDDQSIYAFRGGSPEFVRNFGTHFGKSSTILEIPCCRRCPAPVLNGALAVATQFNSKRLPKLPPTFTSTVTAPIQVVSSPTAEKEAAYIAAKCARVTPSHDALILVPNLKFAKPIVNALRQKRVAYDCRSILAEEGFISLDVLGHWLSNPSDNFALRQTIQALVETPSFGVPSKHVRKKEKIAEREKYLSEISSLWSLVLKNKLSLFDSLKAGSQKSSFLSQILVALEQLLTAYSRSPGEFLEVLRLTLLPWGTPSDMFQEIAAWIDEIRGRGGAGQSAVRVMSMRLAKGLEADYVFVVGLEEGVFPGQNSKPADVEEASRLFFVSMTRAKLELNICHSRTRSAANTYLPNSYALKPSAFLASIPDIYLKKVFLPAESKIKKEA